MGWTRRDFLRAAGITSGVGLLTTLVPLPVAAANSDPKRIVFLNNAQGTDMLSWAPPGSPGGSPLTNELSYQLAPLATYKENLLVLDGVDSIGGTTRGISGLQQDGGHESLGALLTGRPIETTTQAGGPSVDEVIARGLAQAARDRGEDPTPYPALRIGRTRPPVDGNPAPPDVAGSTSSVGAFYWLEAGVSAPLFWGPWETYRLVFGELMGGGDSIERVRAERRSVLDAVRGELGRVRRELPSVDRYYLDRHLDAIRGIEMDLDSVVSCSAPLLPDEPNFRQLGAWNDGETEDLKNSLTLRLISTALSCGLTQVACYNAQGQEGSQNVVNHLPEFAERYEGRSMDLHGNAHGMVAGDHPVDGLTTAPEATLSRQFWADIYRWRADSIKQHLLDTLPPAVRDNTVVLWASEMSEGANHSQYNVPITMFQGDAIDHFDAGKAFQFGEFHPIDNMRPHDNPGKPINQLLASLCHSMDLPIDHFGDEAYPTGGLLEVLR